MTPKSQELINEFGKGIIVDGIPTGHYLPAQANGKYIPMGAYTAPEEKKIKFFVPGSAPKAPMKKNLPIMMPIQ